MSIMFQRVAMSPAALDQRTLVTFLLDRTGLVANVRDQTINAVNFYLDTLRAGGDSIDFTLILFDSERFDQVHVCKPMPDVPNLSHKDFVPPSWGRERRGGIPPMLSVIAKASIPLIDVSCKTIATTAEALLLHGGRPKVVTCFQVDGVEGCSTEHTWEELNTSIKSKVAQGWQFNFLGAGGAVPEQISLMGIPASHVVKYDRRSTGRMRKVMHAAAANIVAFARGDQDSTGFSARQRLETGDSFRSPRTDDPSIHKMQIRWVRETPVL
jgi:hypothetical protein